MESLHSSTEKKGGKIDEPYPNRCTPVTRQHSINRMKKKKWKEGEMRRVPQSRGYMCPADESRTLAAVSRRVEARTSTSCSQASKR
jgi:hypothetical protein